MLHHPLLLCFVSMCQCIRSCTRRAQHLVGSREADGTATPFPLFVERLTSAFGAVSVHAPIGPLQPEEAAIMTAATMERDGQGVDIPSLRPKKDVRPPSPCHSTCAILPVPFSLCHIILCILPVQLSGIELSGI